MNLIALFILSLGLLLAVVLYVLNSQEKRMLMNTRTAAEALPPNVIVSTSATTLRVQGVASSNQTNNAPNRRTNKPSKPLNRDHFNDVLTPREQALAVRAQSISMAKDDGLHKTHFPTTMTTTTTRHPTPASTTLLAPPPTLPPNRLHVMDIVLGEHVHGGGNNDTGQMEAMRTRSWYGIHILTSFYRGTYGIRRFTEILYCLRRNLGNPEVTAVHVLFEDLNPAHFLNETSDLPLLSKLVVVNFTRQPTYKDFFEYANRFLPNRGAAAIIANSDIFFDERVHCASTVISRPGDAGRMTYALSRQPALNLGCPRPGKSYCENYMGSHDAFVFEPPVPQSMADNVDFVQNRMGAENVIIYEFRNIKNQVLRNPCEQIPAFHAHCSHQRTYNPDERISRGKSRIGDHDRHGDRYPSHIECPERPTTRNGGGK